MKSIVRATICAAAIGLAVPAMAATDDAPMHHHHKMHGKHGMMKKGMSGGDAETAKLNDQSLQNAKAGMTPASSSTPSSAGAMSAPPGNAMSGPSADKMSPPPGGAMSAPPGSAMSAPPGNTMAPAPGGAAMTAPGTGMTAMGNTAPNMPSAAPATTPGTSGTAATPSGQ